MKIDLNDPSITSIVKAGMSTVIYYKGGSYVVQNNEDATMRIHYNNGDRVIFQHDGTEYHVSKILTHDGLQFPATEPKASVLVDGSSDCSHKSEV